MRRLRKLVNSSSARPPVIAHSSAMRAAAASGKPSCVGLGQIGRQVEQRLAGVAERATGSVASAAVSPRPTRVRR